MICENCGQKINSLRVNTFMYDAPDYWGDRWPDVECPFSRKPVQLGEWEYD